MKMKNVKTMCFVAVVLFLGAHPALGVLEFKDGLTHDINYQIKDDVKVDWQAPGMYTTVNLLTGASVNSPYYFRGYGHSRINMLGGSIWYLYSYDSSQVNMSSGSIGGFLLINDSSQVDISGGYIFGFGSYGSSQVNISGGLIGGLWTDDFSQVNISGGSIDRDLVLLKQSKIQISGRDFEVDGQTVGFGELTSILGGNPYNEPARYLTGTLLSGELINNNFRIGYDARIVLIPEPATIALLGIGSLFFRKRRK
jgi:hypothetical protein